MVTIVCGMHIGYPHGTAATARVAAYARGLRAAGLDARVVCLQPSEVRAVGVFNLQPRGVVDGVPFEYACGRTVWGATFVQRRWLDLKGLLRGARLVRRWARRDGDDAILLYGDTLPTAAVFALVARQVGAIYLVDVSELPEVRRPGTRLWRSYVRWYERHAFRLFDGAVVVTGYLRRYVEPLLRQGAGALLVPVLVDTDAFAPQAGSQDLSCESSETERTAAAAGGDRAPAGLLPGRRSVVYCGTLNEGKDGVATLIRAFADVAEGMDDIDLWLVGDAYHSSRIPEFRRLAADLGVAERVVFTGAVSRDDVPRYLAAAGVLALARPSSRQAEAGFPTKLAEYLASGRPVVVTRTSEIEEYLHDGESAFLVPPDDGRAFAGALRRALEDPAAATGVGRNGRRVAVERFDYRIGGRLLAAFISSLGRAGSSRRHGEEAL